MFGFDLINIPKTLMTLVEQQLGDTGKHCHLPHCWANTHDINSDPAGWCVIQVEVEVVLCERYVQVLHGDGVRFAGNAQGR